MEINWLTLIAQIINFIILVFLLKHFLYDRVVNAMDERERKISSRFEDADKEKNEAEKMKSEYEEKSSKIEKKREDILSKARKEAEEKRKELIKEARGEVDEMKKEWEGAFDKERERLMNEIRETIGRQVYAVSRKVLFDLGDQQLEKQMLDAFLGRIVKMDDDEFMEKLNINSDGGKGVIIRTRNDIHGNTKNRIEDILNDKLPGKREVNYETSENMICGIEITSGGKSLSWSVDRYLDDFEKEFIEKLQLPESGHD
ncbi:MAG: F0F1 ATP synthase subunit B [candidate division Zixibacteria bacterium]|nr:F0F1 ATP synthase subunit B [candidate division Zixibacteria bacterium]